MAMSSEILQSGPKVDSDINDMAGTELDSVHTDQLDFENGMNAIKSDDAGLLEKFNLDSNRD